MVEESIIKGLSRQCELCRLAIESEQTASTLFCHHCSLLLAPKPRCRRCGLEMVRDVDVCGQCLNSPPLWNSLTCVSDFSYPLSGYIDRFKHQRAYWLAKPLANLLAERVVLPAPLMTWVPLHWQRHLKRGFNQSELLAKQLQGALNNDVRPLFVRQKKTKAQQLLSRKERLSNLQGVFRLKCPIVHKHIAIVDDVVTTGSTVNQLCLLLRSQGVEVIDIYCICRTSEPHKK
ncbi:ComF family protein [Vibrio sonorensis]|uniref:ComF family protein n=1 Tax=Vibrio sonorensis TaxID=1004316 RepID=UPI00111335D4|nr:phosphoribosyltransferase family protein [Vibrio sonorensis]